VNDKHPFPVHIEAGLTAKEKARRGYGDAYGRHDQRKTDQAKKGAYSS
jgi:hypothetical protein